jgi:capsular exopolysaccharide synthesis family protein
MNENEDLLETKTNRTAWMDKFYTQLQRYRNLLARRWWVFLLTIPLAAAIEVWQLSGAPPEFLSVGQMIVNIKLNTQSGSIGSLYSEELGNFLGTQAALMQGQAVIKRAHDRMTVENPRLAPTPVKVDVNVLPKTTIFVLRATGEESKYTQKFLQACMLEYINLKKEMASHTSDTTIAGLTDQIQKLEPELNRIEDQIASFLSTNEVTLLEQSSGLNNFVTILYQRLAEAQSEYDLLQSMTLDQSLLLEEHPPAVVRAGGAIPDSFSSGGNVLLNAGMGEQSAYSFGNSIGMQYLSTKQQILLNKAAQERFAEYYKPQHPRMVALDEEDNRLNHLVSIYRNQSVEQLEARKSALNLQIQNLQKQSKQVGQEDLELSRKRAEYDRLKSRFQRVQSLQDQLLTSLQTLDVNKEIGSESVTVYQSASESSPLQTPLSRSLLIAGFFGLALGFGVLFLMDRLDDRVNNFAELQDFFDEEVLGQIPKEPCPPGTNVMPLINSEQAPATFLESFRNLRSSLLYLSGTGQHPRTLLVTSSVPNDGKSFTATNLAMSLAMSGARVLLVDADLRKGLLHKSFGLEVEKGLGQVLKDKIDWHSVLIPTSVPNLTLLPRGRGDKHTTEFFYSADMETILTTAANEYEYVIIDTPPVMAADDAATLAPRVDGVLFVVRAEATSARVARASLNILHQRKALVLGLVLNSVRPNVGDYYYYGRYKDYHAAPTAPAA